MKASPRFAVLAGALLMLVLGAATSRLTAAHADAALGGGDFWESVIQVGAAVAATACGVGMVLNRRMVACGVLLALTGPAILLAQLPAQDSGSAVVFTAALVGGQLAPFLAGRRLLPARSCLCGAPTGPSSRAAWQWPRWCGACCQPRCSTRGPQDVSPARPISRRYGPIRVCTPPWVSGGWCLRSRRGPGRWRGRGWRLFRAPRILRLIHAPVVLGGMAAALLAAVAAAHALQLPTPEIDPTVRARWLATCCCVAVMAGASRRQASGALACRKSKRGGARGAARPGVAEDRPGPEHRRSGPHSCVSSRRSQRGRCHRPAGQRRLTTSPLSCGSPVPTRR